VLVHAHALFREGLRHYLANLTDFRITGEASNGQQAIQLVDYTDPDLVLMEIDLPGVNGLEVARAIKRTHPHIGIVLLSASMDGQQVVKAIRAGVAAYAPRNVSPEKLLRVLNQVRHGDYPINDLVLSLPDFPQINARFDDDQGVVYRHENVDIGIATQTDNGLIVPVVRHAEARDVWDSAIEVSRLAAAVRANTATKEELSGSTITITSLGAMGGVATTPVINYPEVAIVGPDV
jgi:CheY-like chemotaxis protein